MVVVLPAVLHHKGAGQPAAIIVGAREVDAPAVAAGFGQFLCRLDPIGPGLGRFFGVEPGILEGVDRVVHQRRRVLVGDAVDFAIDHRVGLQRRPEIVEERGRGLAVLFDDRVERVDIAVDHVFAHKIGRHDHRGGRLAGLDRGAGLQIRVVIAAGIDRRRLDVGVLTVEAVDQLLHLVGQLALHRDWEKQIDLDGISGKRGARHRRRGRYR